LTTVARESRGRFALGGAVLKSVRANLSLIVSNWKLSLGMIVVGGLLLFSAVGRLLVSEEAMQLGAAGFAEPPSLQHLFGTDSAGRDLLAMVIYGTPITLEIGLIAGGVGTIVGVLLGLMTGYYRGPVDTIVRSTADIMLTIPALVVLVVIASYVKSTTVEMMSFIIAIFSWPWPARAVRAQTLSLREQAFVRLAKLSGHTDLEIILKELLPNLIPYIAAGFVGAVSGGILASVGLQLLGLGPVHIPTLGMILHFSFEYAAILRGMWWWWAPPTALLALLFIGLFLISMALDEIANPRLKGATA
jgi:peptide/nickel transport system permease protein